MISVFLLAGIGLFGIKLAYESSSQAFEQSVTLAISSDNARQAQVAFKIQVQEWKNLLLRGHNAEDKKKYWEGFVQQESNVQKNLIKVQQNAEAGKEAQTNAGELLSAHSELGRLYRQAFESVNADNPRKAFLVDSKVRGIDRELNSGVDKLATNIRANLTQASNDGRLRSNADYQRMRSLTSWVSIIVILLIGYISWKSDQSRLKRTNND